MRLYKAKDFWAGMFALVCGLMTAVGALNYDLGSIDMVGPGAYPLGLGVILAILGIFITVGSRKTLDQPAETMNLLSIRLRLWFAILVGILLFIFLGAYAGMIPATFAVIFVSALGDRDNSVKTAFSLAFISTIVIVIVFHYLIKLQFELIRWG